MVKRKGLDRTRVAAYTRIGNIWLQVLKYRLHFDTSRSLFRNRVQRLLESSDVMETAKELGVDIYSVRDNFYKTNLLNKLGALVTSKVIDIKRLLKR